MLQGKLALHDVRDAEAFCARILQRSRLELSHHDTEDLLAYLVETAWELSLTYDRGDPQYPPRFSVYATNILRRRVADWSRNRNGRTKWQFRDRVYERPKRQLLSLDDDRLGLTEHKQSLDVEPDRSLDLMRVLGARGRAVARQADELGQEANGRAA